MSDSTRRDKKRQRQRAHLRGVSYDLRGRDPYVWGLRIGRRLQYGAQTKLRTLRTTDAQFTRWTAAAGDRPWSTWAVAQLKAVAKTRRKS